MGESLRLGLGATSVVEAMLAQPNRVWSTSDIMVVCHESERAFDEAVTLLIGLGALKLEVSDRHSGTGRVPDTYAGRRGGSWSFSNGCNYRLTSKGPETLRWVLESSRYSGGVISSLLWAGWDPAKAAWRVRKARRAAKGHGKSQRRRGFLSSVPIVGRRVRQYRGRDDPFL
jgi:hypothetical protein